MEFDEILFLGVRVQVTKKCESTVLARSTVFVATKNDQAFFTNNSQPGRQVNHYIEFLMYLLTVFLVEARTVALTLIKIILNKTNVEKQSLLLD